MAIHRALQAVFEKGQSDKPDPGKGELLGVEELS
jgi:hypothetical protein